MPRIPEPPVGSVVYWGPIVYAHLPGGWCHVEADGRAFSFDAVCAAYGEFGEPELLTAPEVA